MNTTLKAFGMLLGATVVLNVAMVYMGDNVDDFANDRLPPKKLQNYQTLNSVLKVDAQSKEKWTLVDFSTRKTFQVPDPETDKKLLTEKDWDLGFQRTKIISNGGVTNPEGKVAIANLGRVEFNSVTDLPEVKYAADVRSWGNVNNPSVVDWYLYRTRTHNVESKQNVYLVKTGDGYLKVKILNYYCQKAEADCKTTMCSRDEAACLSLEYQYITADEQVFPEPQNPPAKEDELDFPEPQNPPAKTAQVAP